MYQRIDIEDETNEFIDEYETLQDVIEDATRYYHEHFTMDEDYDEDFEVKTAKHAFEFWKANGYEILNTLPNKEFCPLCNSKNIVVTGSEIDGGSLSYHVYCDNCDATFDWYYELDFKGICDIQTKDGATLPDVLIRQHDQ